MEKAGWLTERVRQEEKRLVGRSDAGNRTPTQVCITPFADHKPRSGHARVDGYGYGYGQVMYRCIPPSVGRSGKRKEAGERSRGGREDG